MLLGAVLLFAVACAEAPPRAPEQAQSPAAPATTAPATPASPASPAVDGARAFEHVKQMVAMGPRPAGSAAIERTRAYITTQIEAMGLKVEPQPFMSSTPAGQVAMSNLRVTLPGARPDRIIIASHYDTKPENAFVFVGANDAGSSTGLLIELARVLKDKPRELTYELVFFDGEEAWGDWSSGNTFGSRYYVDAAKKDGTLSGVKAMVLLDMIGERGVQLRQDTSSTGWLNDIVWRTAGRLGHQRTFIADMQAVEDDHMAFLRAGIPAIDLIDLDYRAWHTAGDTLDKLDPRSLQIVGEVVVAALPEIEKKLKGA